MKNYQNEILDIIESLIGEVNEKGIDDQIAILILEALNLSNNCQKNNRYFFYIAGLIFACELCGDAIPEELNKIFREYKKLLLKSMENNYNELHNGVNLYSTLFNGIEDNKIQFDTEEFYQ